MLMFVIHTCSFILDKTDQPYWKNILLLGLAAADIPEKQLIPSSWDMKVCTCEGHKLIYKTFPVTVAKSAAIITL